MRVKRRRRMVRLSSSSSTTSRRIGASAVFAMVVSQFSYRGSGARYLSTWGNLKVGFSARLTVGLTTRLATGARAQSFLKHLPPPWGMLPERMPNTAIRPLRILGLDPGLRRTGWGVVAVSGARIAHVAH